MVIQSIIYFILTIAILVIVHEFGHFITAKISGMRVDAFSVGFGYRLFGFNKVNGFTFGNLPKDFDTQGFTDYRLCVLPLGGYVKIAGMIDESLDKDFLNKEPQPYEFRAKSTGKKIFVITAGVMMNLLLALGIFWGENFFYGKQFTKTTTVGYVEQNSVLDSLGLKSGDKIISVNGKETKYWEDVRTEIFVNTLGKDLTIKALRDGKEVSVFIPRKFVPQDESQGLFLVAENTKPVIVDILKDSPADSAKIKANDIILEIAKTPVYSIPQTTKIISSSKEQQVELTLLREKDTVNVNVIPGKDGKIGILLGGYAYLGESERVKFGFFQSFEYGVQDIARMTQLTFIMLKRVITGEIEFGQAFGGPIRIAQYAAKTADTGFVNFLMFLGLLSLSLAIINILPFPVLDGGHLVIIIIEGILKREISYKVKIAIQNIGMILLLLLTVFIIYNDILNL